MSRGLRALSFVFATCLAAGVAAAQAPVPAPDPAAGPPSVTEAARWKVFYLDSLLGVVIGDASVDWKNEFAVVRFPFGGRTYRLESELMLPPSAQNPRLQFRFKGASPAGAATARPDTSKATTLTGNGEVKVKLGREEDSFAFGIPNAADRDTVAVELAVDADNDMQGRWSYAADPVTQRDAAGGGRTAQFTMAQDGSFGGRQSGSELWLRALPEIDYADVLEDQLEIPQLVSGVGDPTGTADRRTIFIVGRNLPVMPTGKGSYNLGKFVSSSPDADYTYIGQSGDEMAAEDRLKIRRGWTMAARPFKSAEERSALLSLESALIKVRVQPDFVPGVREFTWAGIKIPWRLESADARADVSFVRQTADTPARFEYVPEVYLPEKISVEVRVRVPIPYEAFKVKVRPFATGADGQAHAIAPEQELVAKKVAPQIYRTDPILLSRKGGGGVEMEPGAVLVAHANPTIGLLSAPATAQLRAVLSPAIVPPAAAANAGAPPAARQTRPLWIEYIQRAAKTQGADASDPRDLQTKKETRISKTLIYLLDRLHVDIYYGDHAAMLMMRDTFVELMKRADAFLEQSAKSDETALGYAKLARAMLRADPKAAVGRLPAGSLGGRSVTLAEALDPYAQRKVFGDDDDARDKWLAAAVRTAIADYRPQVQKAMAKAGGIKDDNIEELLKLTGNDFDWVVAEATPRLMQIDNRRRSWVPDVAARGYVGGLKARFEQLRAAQEAADKDTMYVALTAAALTRLPVALSASTLACTLTAAGEGLMLLYTTTTDIYAEIKTKEELAFAFGATPVLGDERFEAAELADPGWVRVLTFAGINVVLSSQQLFADIHKVQVALQVARGARLLEESVLPIYQMSKLAEAERRSLLAFLVHARALKTQGKELGRVQKAALAAFDSLGEIGAKDPEGLAKGLAASGRLRDAQIAIVGRLERETAQGAKKEVLESLRLRRDSIVELWRNAERDPRVLAKLTDFDMGWLSGTIVEADEARAFALAGGHSFDWHELKASFQSGYVSAAEMHNFVTYREKFMQKLLDESIGEVAAAIEKETGTKPNLIRKALGSTNLTSDLDYSAFGEGAERVVKVFNDKFRALSQFRGLESGHVFDTNVYTQAVYELFGRRELVGQTLGIANSDLDALRQLMYEQMATRKYIGGAAEWQKHTAALLAAAPDEATRKMLTYTFEEVEIAYDAAQGRVARQLGVSGDEALHAAEGTNDLLKATNKTYEQLLSDIGQWRTERTRVQQLMTGQVGRLPDPPAEFLERYPGWRAGLDEMTKLKAAGKTAELDALAKTWADRLNYQLRKKQGEALFFASEAYQDEGTILHVVKDLQEAKRGKAITLAKFKGGSVSTVLDKMDGRGALNSMMENLANLRKELRHADDATKAAAKGGKYFVRVLDAGHEGGIDVVSILGEDLVKQTIGVDARRASIDQVAAFLKESGTSDAAYVKAIEDAHETLGAEMVKHKDITDLAGRVRGLFDEVPGAKEAAQKAAAIGEQAR